MSDCYDLLKLYEQGLGRKLQRPLKQKKGFKLLWLPVLARNEVIRSMDMKEIIKLSLSSRRMEGVVRYSKVNVDNIEFHVNIKNSILKIESLNKDVYHCSPDYQKGGSNNLGPQTLSRWIDKDSSSFENCVSIFKHLQNIFLFNSLGLYVNFISMSVEFFKEILTEPALKDFEFLRIDKGEIDVECLNLAMETAHGNRGLYIRWMNVPEDYYHENAFKFYGIYYCDAEWVRIEHLFSLKDCYVVTLVIHNLTYSDVNTYIKYWIDNDHDMVNILQLYMRAFQIDILFDGIVVLLERRGKFYLVAANPTKQRKHQILSVGWYNYRIDLCSWGKDDSWEPEYKVLMALNKKKRLEEELEEIQNSLETNQDQNMMEKKNEISKELQIVSNETDSFNLEFRDGIYSFM